MIKKVLLFLFLFFAVSQVAQADVLKAKTVNSINTENPPTELSIIIEREAILDGIELLNGYVLTGEIVDLEHPKAFGKNATFSLKLISYRDLSGVTHSIKDNYVIKYRQKLKPNWERQSFSLMGSCNGGKTETGIEISPYDFKLMKESKSVGEYLWKDMTKDSFWQPGWELKYKAGETIYFNY